MQKGRIKKITESHRWCCHTFFVPKPGGKIDLVMDLSPVNKHLQRRTRDTADDSNPDIPETATCFATINIANRAQRLINLEIPVLVRSLKSSNVELG